MMQCKIYLALREEGRDEEQKMKMARLKKDMKQEDLAREVDATWQTIGLIEVGNDNPSLRLFVAICRVLDQTLNDLFWEENHGSDGHAG